jgi:DNA-binding transcriptional LysR family regulator
MLVVASKAYLRRHGAPQTPADLATHNRLGFCFARQTKGWPFLDGTGGVTTIAPHGNALVSDGEAMRRLALAGLGVARLAEFHVGRDIAAGRLVPLLEPYDPHVTEPIHAVYIGQAGKMAARVRAFLDYLVAKIVVS